MQLAMFMLEALPPWGFVNLENTILFSLQI